MLVNLSIYSVIPTMKLWGVYKHRTKIPHNNNHPVGTKNVECKKSIIKLSYISIILHFLYYSGREND